MALVRGCLLPDELYYDVARHLWYRDLGDGTWRIGMTAVAAAQAGDLLAFMPKRAGKRVEAGKSCATIESGKWVGAVRISFSGDVVAANEAMIDRPRPHGRDPYGSGWMLVVRPDDPAAARATLVPGSAVAPLYEAWMDAEGFSGCSPPAAPSA